jgi:L-lysine exporter family protein LysE/ArgO
MSSKNLKISNDRQREPLSKSFFSGFMMSITNPLTILFWLGIYGSVLAKTAADYGANKLILYSGAIFLGLLAWDFTMAMVSSGFRTFLKSRALVWLSFLSGLSLIGFGLYFGFQGIKLLLGMP